MLGCRGPFIKLQTQPNHLACVFYKRMLQLFSFSYLCFDIISSEQFCGVAESSPDWCINTAPNSVQSPCVPMQLPLLFGCSRPPVKIQDASWHLLKSPFSSSFEEAGL